MGPDRPDQYREAMHECLQLAGMTAGPEHRAVLVAMAQGWKLLAQFSWGRDSRIPPQPNLNSTS
jgi:hypothetical protein